MCDIWKANSAKKELTVEDLQPHLQSFQKLNVKRVALSGGEAMMHSNLWTFCAMLKELGIKISLLTTGITLKHNASSVIEHCDDVIVSLDGTPEIHTQVRNIPEAYRKLEGGVKEIKRLKPDFRVTARCVIQKSNFRYFTEIIQTAKQLGVDQISFLPADVSSAAFNRPTPWEDEKVSDIALTAEDAVELQKLINETIKNRPELFESRFVAESPKKLLQMSQYYLAIQGQTKFPAQYCNAPWVSAVVESNGDVMPCFFHRAYGNIYDANFEEVINSPKAIQFRKELDMSSNETCRRCVCSLNVTPLQKV
jgi:MoaA/NifB/PqqE/SkfB family radical SAM enzyme